MKPQEIEWWKKLITIPRICASCENLWDCESKNEGCVENTEEK
jgi:hypothetical protein